MDTLTHTLAGLLVGETAARLFPAGGTEPAAAGGPPPASRPGLSAGARRGLFVSLMVVGSNLPDMDFVYSLATGSKLDYLLHHRGHTHTIVGVLAAALLMLAACEAWIRLRGWKPSRLDRAWLAGIALLAPVLHLSMDSTNTYGVHPFWPLDTRWRYGDSVFIVEPLFWAAAMPLIVLPRSRVVRVLLATLVLAAGAWIFSTGLIPPLFGAALIVLTLAMIAVGYLAAPRVSLLAGIGVWAATTLLFIVAHGFAKDRVTTFVSERFPQATLLDHALSPMPVNPLCWEVVLAQVQGEQYALRRAVLSIAPGWITAERCPNRRLMDRATAPLAAVADRGAPDWQWFGELVMPRDRLARLAAERCEAAAFLRFSRMPFAVQLSGRWVLGDLRYDREPGLGFSEIELANPHPHCPLHVPPWTAPRSGLLR